MEIEIGVGESFPETGLAPRFNCLPGIKKAPTKRLSNSNSLLHLALSPFHRGLYSDLFFRRREHQADFVSVPFSSGPLFRHEVAYANQPAVSDLFLSPFHRGLYSDNFMFYYRIGAIKCVSVPFSSGPLFRLASNHYGTRSIYGKQVSVPFSSGPLFRR